MQQLKVVKNFFSKEDIKSIKDYSEDIFTEKTILKNDKSKGWEKGLNTSSANVDIYTLNPIIDFEINDLIVKKLEEEFKMTVGAVNFYYWQNTSNINWHNDDFHGGAATVYLNEVWKREWGGFFIYEKDNKFGIELPKFNKCIFQSGAVEHATIPTTDFAPVRKTIQVFFK